MTQTVTQFAQSCKTLLKSEPGPAGRRKVCQLLQDALKDESFVASAFNGEVSERHILYEDPELGFCILAHHYEGAKDSNPHDHGPSWAIYGQARGETQMTDWDLVEAATTDKPGKVRRNKTYNLVPGTAHVYNEGDLHSPSRAGPTRLIRIEGTNMDRIKRLKYVAI